MSQLYAQLASRPGPWLLGRTSAGLCTLQTACPLTVTYSGGTPAADTIAAGSAATVYGGSAAAFDASADVWVVLTVPGSGALQVTKEADLAAVTGDWAGLARIVQHAVEPYQPQASLAAGGVGATVTPSGTTPLVSSTSAKALSLWNGSSNNSPPANWYTPAFDDSAWSAAVVATTEVGETQPAGSDPIWPAATPAANSEQALCRQHFTLPDVTIVSAYVLLAADDAATSVYINGTALTLVGGYSFAPGAPIAVPPGLLVAGGDNVLAARAANALPTHAWMAYSLTISTTPRGAGTAHEGDLLYYHDSAWIDLPIGTSGQRLASDGTDPYWATGGSGTVTSVALAGPTGTTVSGSPVSTSGTLSLAWSSQSANVVLASPSGSSGVPTFRALVGADMPIDTSTIISSAGVIKGNYQAGSGVSISGNTISATGSGGSVTSVALSLPGIFSVSGSPVTTAGTLSASLASQAPHTFWGGPASGSAAAPTFRALQSSDLPAAAGAGGKVHAHGHFI